ncbi:MAG: FCD domain-containing protein [Hydrogenophaga sp.]|uniref:FadR/GntR family transcriptional regulator n=1 Tax=Hydrogenophaga sp. TaxID=1904254 RepID=UPI00260957B7|nr:FCD domain-containing protein [Hydrogenophaga sp.]MCV0440445.1 FCD domain-containing protein [Hydrogenophaga sp.]
MKANFEKLKKVPAYRALAEAMTEQILDGRLEEGEQVPTESELCEMFGVNRSTVREAIRVLEEANLIRREHARKLLISKPSHQEIGSQLERALLLHEVTFDELWEAMHLLEPQMARLAAQQPQAALIERLTLNIEATQEALSRGESLVRLDIEFHGLIAQMCANRALNLAREPISRLFYPSFQRVMAKVPVAGQRLVGAHKAILDSLIRGDGAAAEMWMQKHITDFKRGLELASVDVKSPVG